MHVVHVIDSLRLGGAEKLLVTFAKSVQGSGIRVTVINLYSAHGGTHTVTPIMQELLQLGVQVVHFTANRTLSLLRILRIARFLRRQKVDVVHSHLVNAIIVGTLAGRLAGIPVVATLHNSERARRKKHILNLETLLLRYGAHRVIAVGHLVELNHRQLLPNKSIITIPNSVAAAPTFSDECRLALRMQIAGDPDRPLLISVGRLCKKKAPIELVTAFASVQKNFPSAMLLLVGGGPLSKKVSEQICSLQLNDSVKLLGPRTDVQELLAASDIYVSASHWEGLPLALLEAMAADLPVIATSVGDVPQILDGRGILVPPGNPLILADAIQQLLAHPEQRQALIAAARQYVIDHHSPHQWINSILSVYRQITDGRSLEALEGMIAPVQN